MIDVVSREYELPKKVSKISEHGPARIVSMCNQKGGVGKTTSTLSLAGAYAELGRKVLIVDFDPQGAATVGLGINAYELDSTVYDLLVDSKLSIDDVIYATDYKNIDIIPANIDLSAAEIQLVSEVARESILKNILDPIRDRYDLILIDCQPSLGLLTVNALTASDGVLIPLAAEYFALRGVALLIDTIEKVQKRLNPNLEIDGIFATLFDNRTSHAHEVVESIYGAWNDKLLHTVISRTVKFPDSTVAAQPITVFEPKSKGAEQYRQLVLELIAKGTLR
ncbi:MAG: AAA family ATPase [Candidatus Ancillula sp.]|jgi:chromosome partitioning protein|nr:AAA family ATPase [Candidatus Ancillula sp.]